MSIKSLTLLLLVLVATAAAQTYVIGFTPNVTSPYPGYVVASIVDLQSAAFAQQYNTIGLSYIAPYNGGAVCCVLGVQEGFLTFGPNSTYSNYVNSFQGNQDTCTSGTAPMNTTFGMPLNAGGPYAGLWLSSLTQKEQQSLNTAYVVPQGYYYCSGQTVPTVFKSIATPAPTAVLPPYIVQPQGPNYPAPTGYSEMYVADVASSTFTSWYNSNGGILLTGSRSFAQNYCCLIRVADGGFLSYGPEGLFSPVSIGMPPYGGWQCGQQFNNQLHILDTGFGGPDTGLAFNTLNSTIVSSFGYFVNNTENWDGCGSNLPDSLTLYKQN